MRKFLIGDIRGDITLFQALLDKIGPGESDTLIFLGSYLGPGNDSKAVLELAIGLKRHPGAFIFLRGCYEYMFLRCIGDRVIWGDAQMWQQMGGEKVFQSYSIEDKRILVMRHEKAQAIDMPLVIPEPHMRFLEHDCHQWFEDDTLPFVATHCGTHPGVFGIKSVGDERESVFSAHGWWQNNKIRIPGRDIVFSHVPFKKPFIGKGKVGIDLGAGLGGKLCAYEAYSQNFTIVG